MNEALVQRLSGWLAGTDIAWLDLRGPGGHVRLHNDGTHVRAVPADEPLLGAARERLTVPAPSVGVFLHAHPLHDTTLATPGQAVAAGQVLGLLRIGALLLPVTAPRSGTFLGHACAHGRTVGYGTPLLHLGCDPSTSAG